MTQRVCATFGCPHYEHLSIAEKLADRALGRVRGTAEVLVNGVPAGVRIWSPYIFDLTDHLSPGENDLEVRVFNTVGPYLDAVSPTRLVFEGQRVSGLMGLVKILEVEG